MQDNWQFTLMTKPSAVKKPEGDQQHVINKLVVIWMGVIVATVIGFLCWRYQLQKQTAYLEKQLDAMQYQQKTSKEQHQQQKQNKQLMDVLKQNNRQFALLSKLPGLLPKQLYLTKLNLDKNIITLSGVAINKEKIIKFSRKFKNATLQVKFSPFYQYYLFTLTSKR